MPHVIGDFVWTALDYLGEAGLGHVWYDNNKAFLGRFPWHQANCGDYDICGFARPQLELRKRVWGLTRQPYLAVLRPDRDQNKAAVSAWDWPEVLPFWDWQEHTGTTVHVVVDACGRRVRIPDRPVTVAVAGSGHLQVLGNSDPCSTEPYRGSQRLSFEGRLLAIVRSAEKPGDILVTAVAEGLMPASLRLTSE